jgi:hypothetical protein
MRMPCKVALLVALLGAVATGCARVAPYERERLAHPTMSSGDLARPSEEHMRSVHEGAIGGGSSVGGGCGCN